MPFILFFFFFNDTATTEIYTLSLHDALPISLVRTIAATIRYRYDDRSDFFNGPPRGPRSEEHTSELQSHLNLVCRLLLEKKKIYQIYEHVISGHLLISCIPSVERL